MAKTEVIQGIKMVTIPAGSYMMGHDWKDDPALDKNINKYFQDEQPVHKQTLKAFQLGETQITQAQYERMDAENLSAFKGNDLPVTNLGPNEIKAFCNTASKAAGLEPCYDMRLNTCDPTKNGFRMPTEAEWEYACRAGTSTLFNTGNTEQDLAQAGWYKGNSGGNTHPVGGKAPNAWGLYDMHGNVFEFCEDDWNPNLAYRQYLTGGEKPDFSNYHALNITRGGGWFSDAAVCRSFTRAAFCSWDGINQSYYMGFRVARSV
ncbi:formylglycine-generating enzyme family protein [Candidatus Latescibacterota bacterium]